jgi:aminoglycoside phosphotransferase (APT) family kinase protein
MQMKTMQSQRAREKTQIERLEVADHQRHLANVAFYNAAFKSNKNPTRVNLHERQRCNAELDEATDAYKVAKAQLESTQQWLHAMRAQTKQSKTASGERIRH